MNAMLIVTGALTALAGVGLAAPRLVVRTVFGTALADAATVLVARHWCLLIALVGGLLIYAGFHTEARVPIMVAAIVEKLAFGALVVTSPMRKRLATIAVAGADAAMAVLYILSLAQSS
jgi:hypothetical protein